MLQVKKLQTMTSTEPPISRNMVTFTPQLIQEHINACDVGIHEVQEAFIAYMNIFNDKYLSDSSKKINIIRAVSHTVNKIKDQLQVIRGTIMMPDNSALIIAIASITESLERFCASVYYALSVIEDNNDVLKVYYYHYYLLT